MTAKHIPSVPPSQNHPAVIGGSVMACPYTDMDGRPGCTYKGRRGAEEQMFGSFEAAACWVFGVPVIARTVLAS